MPCPLQRRPWAGAATGEGMAEPEKSPFENLIAGPSGWPDAYHQLQQLIGARGAIPFLLLAASLFVWWKWEDIVKRPGVERVIGRFERSAIPAAPAGHLTMAVAHLARDKDREHENLLLDELRQFEGVKTISVDHTPDPEQPAKRKAEEKARGLLQQTGADVLIWGGVISLSGKSAMRLYWTPARDVPGAKSTGKYQPQTETIALPAEFWSDLKQILGLLTQSRIAALTFDQPGHYVADRLAPLIAQVRALVQSKEGVWNPETLAGVQFSLAHALALDGEQSGKNESLAESIELYRKVLDECTRARVPFNWAMTQNNLGNALEMLGERESGTARLEEAIAAFREALQEFTRERAPLLLGHDPESISALRSEGSASGRAGRRGWRRLSQPIAKPYRNIPARARHSSGPATQINLGVALASARRAGERDGAARGGRFRLSRSLTGMDPRARAAPMGHDADVSRQCAQSARRAGGQGGAARGSHFRLSRSLAGIDPRARAVPMGRDSDGSRQCAQSAWRAGERDGEARGGRCRLRDALQEWTRARVPLHMGQEHRQSGCRPHAARGTARRCARWRSWRFSRSRRLSRQCGTAAMRLRPRSLKRNCRKPVPLPKSSPSAEGPYHAKHFGTIAQNV